MTKKAIIFELLALYFQEQNGVSKRVDWTIIDMNPIIIFAKNIKENL